MRVFQKRSEPEKTLNPMSGIWEPWASSVRAEKSGLRAATSSARSSIA
jgi:hypothetical protein